jgi:hypothetical protein
VPDQKISALAELTSADTADLLEIVDVGDTTMAATGTNKRITVANLKTAVGGSVATDALWDAKGDLAAGTGANTASKLTVGSNGTLLVADSGEATGLRWGAFGLVLYGLGSDGDVTISSNTTLTGPMLYDNLTVSSGVTLTVSQWPIQVRGTLTLNGTISANGNDANNQVGGSQLSNNRLWQSGGTVGGTGTSGAGANGTNATFALGGAGGNGGSGWSGVSGGTGGTVSAPNAELGGFNSPAMWLNALNCQANTLGVTSGGRWQTGAGGGAGGGDASSLGAGGGGGGGGVWIAARRLAGTGTISAKGGNGANGRGTNGGGGGGGGGGVVILITQSLSNPFTIDVGGGTAGTGAGTGNAGTNGSSGRSYVFLGVM